MKTGKILKIIINGNRNNSEMEIINNSVNKPTPMEQIKINYKYKKLKQ